MDSCPICQHLGKRCMMCITKDSISSTHPLSLESLIHTFFRKQEKPIVHPNPYMQHDDWYLIRHVELSVFKN